MAAALFGCLGCFGALFSVVAGLWLLTAWAASRQGGDEQGAIHAGRAAIKDWDQATARFFHMNSPFDQTVKYTWTNEHASRPGGTPQSPVWLVTGTVTFGRPSGSRTTSYQLVLSWGAGDEYRVQEFSAEGARIHVIDGHTVHPDPD